MSYEYKVLIKNGEQNDHEIYYEKGNFIRFMLCIF